jgi:glycosyltransferase involved in cell wall biosynthesis
MLLELAEHRMTEPSAASRLPKRVLHVMNSASGGAAISTLDLIAACRKAGFDSVVVCHEAGLPQDFQRVRDAVDGRVLFRPLYWMNRKIRSPWWKRPAIELYQFWRSGAVVGSSRAVAEFAARHQVELIHTNTILTPEGGRAARILALPHVWHVRELVGPGMPFRFYRTGRMLGRYLERQATLVVANSQVTASKLRDFISPDVLRVVPNGIDVQRFAERSRGDDVRPVVVAMVGNVTQWKKHDLFIEAAAAVDRSLPVEFRIYGHLPATPELRAPLDALIARHGLAERFRLMGFVGDPRQIMAEIDVLVHTADHESFGRVLVEGMAARLPVVAVRGGGAAEIVVDGETGLLAAPNCVPELTERIERLVRDPSLRRCFGNTGRRRAEVEFSLERCFERMQILYDDAMARHARNAVS